MINNPQIQTEYKNYKIQKMMQSTNDTEVHDYLRRVIKDYISCIYQKTELINQKDIWVHINLLADCLRGDEAFINELDSNKQFNFRDYYDQMRYHNINSIVDSARKKLRAQGIFIGI